MNTMVYRTYIHKLPSPKRGDLHFQNKKLIIVLSHQYLLPKAFYYMLE